MPQPESFAKQTRLLHLTAVLKASHAARLMRKGLTEEAAARRAGYSCVKEMRRAIRKYVKSPAPVATGNGAGKTIHP